MGRREAQVCALSVLPVFPEWKEGEGESVALRNKA